MEVRSLRQKLHESIPFYEQHLLCGSQVLTEDLALRCLACEKRVETLGHT